jgi:hypothetical protein
MDAAKLEEAFAKVESEMHAEAVARYQKPPA